MYGLLGESLSHSFSPLIHALFGNNSYRLFETSDLKTFFAERKFKGINVTIPYKKVVAQYLDEIGPIAMRTGSINTIINRNGKLIGEDTDYFGLRYLIDYYSVPVSGKTILILGNGGAAQTVECLMKDLEASSVNKLSRTPKASNDFYFTDYQKVCDCDIIINTTPVGMFPHNDDPLLINIHNFPRPKTYIDLIYNPLRTSLFLEAQNNGISSYNGFLMLVAQAKTAHDLFFDKKTPISEISRVYHALTRKMTNLVFIGMPLSGKSLYARMLNGKYHKRLVDTDQEIEAAENMTITELFRQKGERYFREREFDFIKSIYKSHGLMISTGGGMIQNPELMNLLRQNGLLIFIDREKEDLAQKQLKNRPLIASVEDLFRLYEKRHPLYEKYADIVVKIPPGDQYHHVEIEAKINEYFSR
ncbi:MAG: shikimate kinase [Candidatus Izemoplasmatales bacterium]|jgi:shikimate dehydrogenase